MNGYELLKFIYGKYNELNSLKKYTQKDDVMYKIIEAKLDTLKDIEKMIDGKMTTDIIFSD